MGERLTDDDLKRLRDLADKATPGPWVIEHDAKQHRHFVRSAATDPDGDHFPVLDTHAGLHDCRMDGWPVERNVAFIAASRDALPRLLSEVTDLRREVEALTDDIASALDSVTAEAVARDRAESLLSEVRALVDAERRQHGPSAFSDALWETLTLEVDAAPPAEAADAVQGEFSEGGESVGETAKSKRLRKPMEWAGLGKD